MTVESAELRQRPGPARLSIAAGLGAAALVAAFGGRAIATAAMHAQSGAFSATAVPTVTALAVYALVVGLLLVSRQERHLAALRNGGHRYLAGAGLGVAAALVAESVARLTIGPGGDGRVVAQLSQPGWARIAIVVMTATVFAPIVEEWLFRGVVQRACHRFGTAASVVASACLFSAWHAQASAAAYYLALGCILGYVYERWGLSGSTAAHASFNAVLLLATAAAS
jgi:membrane protease YdiL (CAAX protease family)